MALWHIWHSCSVLAGNSFQREAVHADTTASQLCTYTTCGVIPQVKILSPDKSYKGGYHCYLSYCVIMIAECHYNYILILSSMTVLQVRKSKNSIFDFVYQSCPADPPIRCQTEGHKTASKAAAAKMLCLAHWSN